MMTFFKDSGKTFPDLGLLILRLGSGFLMIAEHGWPKLQRYPDIQSFPDPLGLGGPFTWFLAIMAEVICAGLLMLGVATRLVLLPLIATMLTAAFIVNAGEPLAERELALIYLFPFILLLLSGPGKYTIVKLFKK